MLAKMLNKYMVKYRNQWHHYAGAQLLLSQFRYKVPLQSVVYIILVNVVYLYD